MMSTYAGKSETVPPDPEKIRLRMATLCARSEQCSADILLKIRRAGLTQRQASEITGFLRREKFLDDVRFARAFASDKVRFQSWGRLKIRMGLRAKRIPEATVELAIADIPQADYDAALMKAARTKASSLDLADFRDRRKLYASLASRGFASEEAAGAIRRLIREINDTPPD